MILNSYVHAQFAAAHREDLLQAAEQARRAAQVRERRGHPFRFSAAAPGVRRQSPARNGLCVTCTPTATR